jgi:hypothetical protein
MKSEGRMLQSNECNGVTNVQSTNAEANVFEVSCGLKSKSEGKQTSTSNSKFQ